MFLRQGYSKDGGGGGRLTSNKIQGLVAQNSVLAQLH